MLQGAIKVVVGIYLRLLCRKKKKNKGKKLEKKNRVIEAMRSWTLKIVKNGEREENMRKVWLCETKRGWGIERKDLPIENWD